MADTIRVERGKTGNWNVLLGDGYQAWSSEAVWAALMALRFAQETRCPEPTFSEDFPSGAVAEAKRQLELIWRLAK
jgi:hypothetical protein